jgi:DNA-binding transcriptional LysR family regulator
MHSEKFAEFLGVFADVAREGSFSGAARRRGITPSSIARQIDLLESQLATPLFLRSTRMLRLTEAGEALLIRARQILDALVDAQQEIASIKGEVTGTLRVACFPTFGKRYVIPVVSELVQEYPQLNVELDLTERLADPVSERLDVVIRIGDVTDSSLIATFLAPQTRILCASQAYLAQGPRLEALTDLLHHRLIDKMHGADLLCWSDVLGNPPRQLGKQPIFLCDDFEAMRLAALEGMGVGFLPDWVIGADILEGRLIHVLPRYAKEIRGRTSIVALRALRQPAARVSLFLDRLRNHIGSPPVWTVSDLES